MSGITFIGNAQCQKIATTYNLKYKNIGLMTFKLQFYHSGSQI